jgi:preprotein translocase subunit SecG
VIAILLTVLHVLVCLFLIVVVLLQSGKAADLAGAFGGMGSQTAFGPRGSATLLSKATTISAIVFMITSMTLSIVAQRSEARGTNSILGRKPVTRSAPATPGAKPPTPTQNSAPKPAAPVQNQAPPKAAPVQSTPAQNPAPKK